MIKYRDEYHRQMSHSFALFAQHCFYDLNGKKFTVKDFHLQFFSTLQDVYDGKIQRLIVNIPPRHGKSELMALFQAYVFFNNPSANNMLICYSKDLQVSKNKLVKKYVDVDLFHRYSDLELEVDRKGNMVWQTRQHGEQYSSTISGQALGSGAGVENAIGAQGGLIVIDDPNKASEMKSSLYRNSIIDTYTDTISTRINSATTPIVIIQQRVHEEDLSGYLLGGGDGHDWYVLKVPVFNAAGDDTIYPERLTYADAKKKQLSNPTIFAGQYLQSPQTVQGNIFFQSWFESQIVPVSMVPKDLKKHIFIDGAYSSKTSADPTAILVTCYNRPKGVMYILHAEKKRLNMPDLLKRVKELYKMFSIKLVLAEPRATGTTLVQLLKDDGYSAAAITSKSVMMDKELRAHQTTEYVESGRVCLVKGGWNRSYIYEMCLFPNGRHDDYVDASCYAIERYMYRTGLRFF